MSPVLRLRAMTDDELPGFLEQVAQMYADEQSRLGFGSPAEALAEARAGNAELLPQGLHTPGQLILVAEDDGGPVGELWIQTAHPRGRPDTAWINDIEIRAERRGEGLGRALLAAAEQRVRELGIGGLGLNVHGANTVARRLYESSGYEVDTMQMRKPLA